MFRFGNRLGIRVALTGVVLVSVFALPATGAFLIRILDRSPVLDVSRIGDAQAIVVLGGGTRQYAPEYGGPTLGSISLSRVRYGAYLARTTGLPILVSGGSVRGAPPEATLMRDVLVHEFHVPVRWVETRSRDTHENAVNSGAILKASGATRVILVGHGFDFPRSAKEFEAQGIVVIRAPINVPDMPTELDDFLPSAGGMLLSYYACYEILANAVFEIGQAFNGSSADTRSTPRSSSPLPRGS
jgi:uncharacterized SAM-binding protein YcdF (DUF218 family)